MKQIIPILYNLRKNIEGYIFYDSHVPSNQSMTNNFLEKKRGREEGEKKRERGGMERRKKARRKPQN